MFKKLFFVCVFLLGTAAYGEVIVSGDSVPNCAGIFVEDSNYPDGYYGQPVYINLTEPHYWVFFDTPSYSWYVADEVTQSAGVAWYNDGPQLTGIYMPHTPYVYDNIQVAVPEPSTILLLMIGGLALIWHLKQRKST